MQYAKERMGHLIKEALDTTAKPDSKAFGTASHAAAIEQERKSGQKEVTRYQRASRLAESVEANQRLNANNNKVRSRG